MYDITIFYDKADAFQLQRLKKLVRCKKREKGKIVKCNRAFFNYNIDMIDDVESTENYYAFVAHTNFLESGKKPPIDHPKITHLIGVSEFATEKLDEIAKNLEVNIKTEKCYNPLTLEPKEKVKILVAAARLDDEIKGGKRIKELIKKLDEYCIKNKKYYLFLIFSNSNINVQSENVIIMQPRIDVRPYIAMADFVVNLSNDAEVYSYTINEALGYGVPIVTTPLSILKELPITDNETIILNWDYSNIDEVVEQIFKKKVKKFNYISPKDNWDEILAKGKSMYQKELQQSYLVEATDKYQKESIYSVELSKQKGIQYFPKKGERWIVNYERKEKLVESGLVKLIKEE